MTNIDAERILMFMLGKHGYVDIMATEHENSFFLYAVEDENYLVKYPIGTIHPYSPPIPGGMYCIFEQLESPSISIYLEMLELLLDACKRNDIYINDNKLTLLLKKGTTLEQLKIEMDLESNEND